MGAALPLVPFLAGVTGQEAILAASVIALLSLAGVGMALSLFTGRGAWMGALRMVADRRRSGAGKLRCGAGAGRRARMRRRAASPLKYGAAAPT